MAESGDPILSADVSIETHNAAQALRQIAGVSDQSAGALDKLTRSVERVEASHKQLGQTADGATKQIVDAARAQDQAAEASIASAKATDASSDSVQRLRNEWNAAISELNRGVDRVKGQIDVQRQYQQELNTTRTNISAATQGTAALGSAASSMVTTFLGLTSVNALLSNLVGNIDRAAQAAREAGAKGIQQQTSALDVANALNLQGPSGLAQAQRMIQGVMQRARASEEQAIGAIVGARETGLDPTAPGGMKIVDIVAQFAGRNKVTGEAMTQLAKVMSDTGAQTPQAAEQFLSRVEAGFHMTPTKNMEQFLRGMMRGVVEPAGAQGADFWQTFSQYIGAVRTTGTERQAASAMAELFNVTSGTGDKEKRFLARAGRLQGITSAAIPTDDELRQHALTRELPEDEAVISASDRMEKLSERADREREQYEKQRENLLKPYKGRKLTIEKIREHDTKVDRDLTLLDNERERKLADFERELQKAQDDEKDARKKLAEKLASQNEVKAFIAAGPEARIKIFRSFLQTEQGRQQLLENVGTSEQTRMAIAMLRPEAQAVAGQAMRGITAPGVLENFRKSQTAFEQTSPAQAAATAAQVYKTESEAATPGAIGFELLLQRSEAEWKRRASRGEFDTFGGDVKPDRAATPMIGTGQQVGRPQRPFAIAYTEENQKIDVAVEAFLRQLTTEYQAMSQTERTQHPELLRMIQDVQTLYAPRTQGEQIKSWSADYKKSAMRRLVAEYENTKHKRDAAGAPSVVGTTAPIGQPHDAPLPPAPSDADIKAVPVAPGGSSRAGDFGLPAVPSSFVGTATTAGAAAAGTPHVVNNVTIGTVVSRGGDALSFPAPLDRNAGH